MPNRRRRKEEGLLTRLFSDSWIPQSRAERRLKGRIVAKIHRKQHSSPSTLRRNAAMGLVSLAVLAGIGGILWDAKHSYPRSNRGEVILEQQSQPPAYAFNSPVLSTTMPEPHPFIEDRYTPSELTLENVKERIYDTKLGQAYLNKLLREGKVKFQWTEVIYDPHVENVIAFLESQLQLTEDPVIRNSIKWEIEELKSDKAQINKYRNQIISPYPPKKIPYIALAAVPFSIGGLPKKVFVFELHPINSDEDVTWILYHEWCHVEPYVVVKTATPTKYDPKKALEVLPSVLRIYDVREAICYHAQLEAVRNGTFNPSRRFLEHILDLYTPFYESLSKQYRGDDITSVIVREIVDGIINPHTYKLPPNK